MLQEVDGWVQVGSLGKRNPYKRTGVRADKVETECRGVFDELVFVKQSPGQWEDVKWSEDKCAAAAFTV